jgi:hypothetical protein
MKTTALVFFCLGVLVLWSGCYSTSHVSRDQIEKAADYDICGVVTTGGDSIALKEVSGTSGSIRDSTIVGIGEDGKVVRIPLSKVRSIQVTHAEAVDTVFAVIGITVGFFALVTLALVGPE